MLQWFNKKIDKLSDFLAPRKGLLPLIGISLVLVNFILQFFPVGWFGDSNILLHAGVVIAILGLMSAWAL